MLDSQMLAQLADLFSKLESNLELRTNESTHADQAQLLEMLHSVASTSDKISVVAGTDHSVTPAFQIYKNGKKTGIHFSGIPTGHEFSSLILAILNSDGKGKLPDDFMTQKIKSLKGKIKLSTYISLTCENCPDVVQALNQMALIHPHFEHEMKDGAYFESEINTLGIQGVPSVIHEGTLISSGRISFLDLLNKLETHFGVDSSTASTPQELGEFDVAVIGGGPAGAAAAIYSVRKGLKTILITEKMGGQVQETKGIENLIATLYTEGPQLAANLNSHLGSYPVKILENRRVKTISKDAVKKIALESGENLTAQAVIVATGAKWRELGIPGEKEYLGRGVAFCPHCDGPYYKGKDIAVVGGGNSGIEAAIDLAGIVKSVVVFEYNDKLKADQVLIDKLLSLPNARILTSAKTTEIVGDGKTVQSLKYFDRENEKEEELKLDGIFVQIGLLPNSQFLKGTVDLTPFGEIVIDPKGRTSEPGIYAAGDVTTIPYKQIIIAMGEGAKTSLTAFEDRMRAV
jgi:alkyl hydroperoxide reductase subunit F